MTRTRLADIAPRLALARDERVAELTIELAERREMRERLLRAEWLVAHRELQQLRAGLRSARYLDARIRKTEQARVELAQLQAQAARIGVT